MTKKTKAPAKKAPAKEAKKPVLTAKPATKPAKKVAAPVKKSAPAAKPAAKAVKTVVAPTKKPVATKAPVKAAPVSKPVPKAPPKPVKAAEAHLPELKSDNYRSDKVLLTKEGLQKLQEELAYLQEFKREDVAKRLKEAISYGDLSENSEYEEAKNEQAFCEGRIVELQKMIKNAELIDEKTAHRTAIVRIGTTVVIKNLTKDEEPAEFTIVGSTEADPFSQRISNESPIGKELLGKKKGDKVKIVAPGGTFDFQLVDLK